MDPPPMGENPDPNVKPEDIEIYSPGVSRGLSIGNDTARVVPGEVPEMITLSHHTQSNSESRLDEEIYETGTERNEVVRGHIRRLSAQFSELCSVARGAQDQFHRNHDPSLIDIVVECGLKALHLPLPRHGRRRAVTLSLASYLNLRSGFVNNMQDREKSVVYYKASLSQYPAGDTERPAIVAYVGTSIQNIYNKLGGIHHLEDAINFHREAVLLQSLDNPDRAGSLQNLGSCLLMRFHTQRNVSDLDEVIQYLREAEVLCPPGHANRRTLLHALIGALELHCERQRKLSSLELEEIIRYYKEELQLYTTGIIPISADTQLSLIRKVATCLFELFQKQQNRSHLQEATKYFREIISMMKPGHRNESNMLTGLGTCLQHQYFLQPEGGVEVLEEAIQCHLKALNDWQFETEDYNKSDVLLNLGICLERRYVNLNQLQDLEDAIKSLKEALEIVPMYQRERVLILHYLGTCIEKRYKSQYQIQDLEQSIQYLKEARGLHSEEYPDDFFKTSTLHSLGLCLMLQYEQEGQIQRVKDAIGFIQEELKLPLGMFKRISSLQSLTNCLSALALSTSKSDIEVLEQNLAQAIFYFKDMIANWSSDADYHKAVLLNGLAMCLCYKGNIEEASILFSEVISISVHQLSDSDCSSVMNDVASTLCSLYLRTNKFQYLEEAILYQKKAVSSCQSGNPARPTFLYNLGTYLIHLTQEQVRSQDLTEATNCLEEAIALLPAHASTRSKALCELAFCLHLRNTKFAYGEPISSEKITGYFQEALQLQLPGNPRRPHTLHSFGIHLYHSINSSSQHNIQELDKCIQCLEEALQLISIVSADHTCAITTNLAACSHMRYLFTGNIHDINRAFWLASESIQHTPPNHPSLSCSWQLLALIRKSVSKQAEDLLILSYKNLDPCSLFQKAANHPLASIQDRLQAAFSWIESNSLYERQLESLAAYETYLKLFDQLLHIKAPSIRYRHELLLGVPPTIASDGAACAIDVGDIVKAVELLEQGRTLLWSQLEHYHAPIDLLQKVDPILANDLEVCGQQLECSAISKHLRDAPPMSMDNEVYKYREISERWNTLVSQVRQLDGFANFLQSPPYSALQQACVYGPVIIINISTRHCDTIIIQRDGDPTLVPLPGTQLDDIANLVTRLSCALDAGPRGSARIIGVLRSLWDDIVEPVVQMLQQLKVPLGSRIWWCPTSDLGLLPIHAAGPYRRNMLNLPDMYISSYTSSLSALMKAIQAGRMLGKQEPSSAQIPHLLMIAQPETPTQVKIPSVLDELDKIQQIVPNLDTLLGENARREAVVGALRTHSWVHISCHGVQRIRDPFKSCFKLYDKPLHVLDIIEARLPHAEFAFLSACHTAAGDERSPDEKIHLAAGLQFAGFRSVIGTMYAMADIDGPQVAEAVYKHLFRHVGKEISEGDVLVDYRDAAEALNIATRALRNSGVPVERWINFIHIGA
ncbi:hypothetical protein FRC02_010781 [Tulasnella sp. 418]|nr:hypothetical protein FRC02_010781 [Tulasnella sp. 418]